MTIHFQKFRRRHPPPANQSQNKIKKSCNQSKRIVHRQLKSKIQSQ